MQSASTPAPVKAASPPPRAIGAPSAKHDMRLIVVVVVVFKLRSAHPEQLRRLRRACVAFEGRRQSALHESGRAQQTARSHDGCHKRVMIRPPRRRMRAVAGVVRRSFGCICIMQPKERTVRTFAAGGDRRRVGEGGSARVDEAAARVNAIKHDGGRRARAAVRGRAGAVSVHAVPCAERAHARGCDGGGTW